MSLVPSEIEYQDNADPDRAVMGISGVAASFMMCLLAAGFVVVGFVAFQRLSGGATVLADASAALAPGDRMAAVEVEPSSPTLVDSAVDRADAAPETPPATSEETYEPPPAVVDMADPVRSEPALPVSGEDALPAGQPLNSTVPSVVYDPSIFDDVAPAGNEPESDRVAASVPDHNDASNDGDASDDEPNGRAASQEPLEEPVSPGTEDTAPSLDALSGSHVVQVGSFRSEAEALADWGRFEGQFKDLLDGKIYNIQSADLGERGVFYRLRIGPFEDADEARAHCRRLTERGRACLAVRHKTIG